MNAVFCNRMVYWLYTYKGLFFFFRIELQLKRVKAEIAIVVLQTLQHEISLRKFSNGSI